MGDVAGGGADGYYRRYTYEQLWSMVLADSVDDAEANRVQWRRLGALLSDAATAADKIAKRLPEHYRSQHGAPALLNLLHDTNETMGEIGQVAYDNGTAWLGVKQSLQDAQADVARLEPFARSGLGEQARDYAADRIQKLTSEYINHANDILPPPRLTKQPFTDPLPDDGPPGASTTPGPGGGGAEAGTGLNEGANDQAGDPGTVGWVPTSRAGTAGPALGGGSGQPPGNGSAPVQGGGVLPGRASRGTSGSAPRLIGIPGVDARRAGGSFPPVGRTLGGKSPAGAGLPGGPTSPTEGEPGAHPPDGPGDPAPKPATPGEPGAAGPGGPGAMSPQGGGGKRRRQIRGRGGLKGDPNDFRYEPDVVAPAEIWPDEERPVTNVGKTIGGKQVNEEPQWTAPEPAQKRPESTPRSSPLPDGEVRIDGHIVAFKMRRSGGA